MDCLNLQKLFGKTYKITFDPAYDHKSVPRAKLDPWMMQIPCKERETTIYPFDAVTLAIEAVSRRTAAKELDRLGLKVHQDAWDFKTFLFDVSQFDKVAAIVSPRKRRILTETQKAERRERLAAYAFKKKVP
jgi:hypothetical protein